MMKTYLPNLKAIIFILIVATIFSCKLATEKKISGLKTTLNTNKDETQKDDQIGEYVAETFEDSKGNLWFGTLSKGIAKYDGKKLKYFTVSDGLPSNRVTTVVEDSYNNLWFGTENGISKYDGENFINFNIKDGLCNNSISNILLDSKGVFWIGTWGGVCKFDGENFTNFNIPVPKINTQINEDTKNWITEIMEDSKGNIWFGRDSYGACKYDGKKFTHYLKKDGLYANNVQGITEDKEGNVWFGTRVAEKDNADPNKRFGKGGVQKYDGSTFINFPEIKGFNENDVYQIYKDNLDNLWIGTLQNGVYKYDGKTFENFKIPKSVMSVLQDNKGKIWVGCAGGLFTANTKGIFNVTTSGPWN
jgi:ligand-binding sensor domain-containing protein